MAVITKHSVTHGILFAIEWFSPRPTRSAVNSWLRCEQVFWRIFVYVRFSCVRNFLYVYSECLLMSVSLIYTVAARYYAYVKKMK